MPSLNVAVMQASPDLTISIVGVIAATLTTSSFLPQIIKAYRTKCMRDVSSYLLALFASGTTLWLAYGIFKGDLVIIGANVFGTAFNVILLFMKRSYIRSSS